MDNVTSQKASRQKNRAQSATELAAFGGIIIFIIGMIIRSGLTTNLYNNAQLRALRMALTESFRTAEGDYAGVSGAEGANARNYSSTLILEDRLSVAAGEKFGTRDRMPVQASVSATMSHNLFRPVDYGDNYDLPVQDIIVNGQRFPMTTAGFKGVSLDCGLYPACPNRNTSSTGPFGICCDTSSGLVKLFKIVGNYPNSDDCCFGGTCMNNCGGSLSIDERFDLDFDGIPDVLGDDRDGFMWQWYAIWAVESESGDGIYIDMEEHQAESNNDSVDVDGDNYEETIMQYAVSGGRITYVQVMDFQEGDLDNSRSSDSRLNGRWANAGSFSGCTGPAPSGACPVGATAFGFSAAGVCTFYRCVFVTQSALDENNQVFTFVYSDPNQRTNPGTYLRVQEGQLVPAQAGGQYTRSTQRHNQLDIIERILVMNKDTGRFCSGSTPQVWGTSPFAMANGLYGLQNPVEACGNCYTGGNQKRTCFDGSQAVMFIRSRIQDLRGRRWIRLYSF